MRQPNVSIAIITYNQDQYITEAIESVLAQKNCGEIEIIVGDDASTDSTKIILEDYQNKYPSIFRIISRKSNIGASKNLYEVFARCTGKYIAVLEGDDFWTNPDKLKEQTSFLESNESCIACTHRYKVVDEVGNVIQEKYFGPGNPRSGLYGLRDFQEYKYFGHLGALVFRNILIDNVTDYSIVKDGDDFIADISLNLFLCFQGNIYVLDSNMAASRLILKDHGTNYKSTIHKKNQIMARILYLEKLKKYAYDSHGYRLDYENRNEYYFAWSILHFMRHPSAHNFTVLAFTFNLNKSKAILFWYLISNLDKLFFLIKKQFRKMLNLA
jgi:glycosyltransferase involved in cell wall biosynthesis